MNIDITVAMPCGRIGADVLDSTEQDLYGYDSLEEEDTWWELTPEQRAHFEALKHMNSYLREEYHAIHELLWKSNQVTLYSEMPARYVQACYFFKGLHVSVCTSDMMFHTAQILRTRLSAKRLPHSRQFECK